MKRLKTTSQPAQYQWTLVNLSQNNLNNSAIKVDQVIKLHRVILELLPPEQIGAISFPYAEYLARNGKKSEAYEFFKSAAFAIKAPAIVAMASSSPAVAKGWATKMATINYATSKAAPFAPTIVMPVRRVFNADGVTQGSPFNRVVDLATELNRLDELAESAKKEGEISQDWTIQSELLRAMIARRKKDERPMELLASQGPSRCGAS